MKTTFLKLLCFLLLTHSLQAFNGEEEVYVIPSDGVPQNLAPENYYLKNKQKLNTAIQIDQTDSIYLFYAGISKSKYYDGLANNFDDALYNKTLSGLIQVPLGRKWELSGEIYHDLDQSSRGFNIKGEDKDREVGDNESISFTYSALFIGYRPEILNTPLWTGSLRLGYHQESAQSIVGFDKVGSISGVAASLNFLGKIDKENMALISLTAGGLNNISFKKNDAQEGAKSYTKGNISMNQYSIGAKFAHIYQLTKLFKVSWHITFQRSYDKQIVEAETRIIRNGRYTFGVGIGI